MAIRKVSNRLARIRYIVILFHRNDIHGSIKDVENYVEIAVPIAMSRIIYGKRPYMGVYVRV